MNISDLKNPFEPSDLEFRAGATTNDKSKALALPYITSRAVQDRLNSVVGPENWRNEYQPGPSGGVVCGLSIRVGDEWITKWDGAESTNFEAVKGGLSDAFKRAAVQWGIGRYLYALPAVWVTATQRGKSVVVDEDEARAKLFGSQGPHNGSNRGATRQNGKSPQVRSFRTFDGLLYQIHADFGLNETDAKARLKELGYSSFKVSESVAMYEKVAATFV